MSQATINPSEIDHFAKDSMNWWDENGAFAPLHKLNPARLSYLKSQITAHFGSVKGLNILDIGCGGGLVCEPLTRLGAHMTGIDGDAQAIDIATSHAKGNQLDIKYLCGDAQSLIQSKKRYDVVLGLEVIEHVNDPDIFIDMMTQLVKPNGLLILSTLNRTPKSYALGIVMAEYVLRWVPRGTHSWQKFVKPSELSRMLRRRNWDAHDITGLIYNPLSDSFSLSPSDVDVNYFLTARKAP
jgi:2-polyprenyl-6-hydroxyphenyl methylase/3-demethylubiquinone-9 3-methyltransferase